MFMSSLQNFAMLETRSWVWSRNVFDSENLLDLDSLWNQPFRLGQLLLEAIDTLVDDSLPIQRFPPLSLTGQWEQCVINHQEGSSLCVAMTLQSSSRE